MPASKYRIKHGRQIGQTFVTFQLNVPAAYCLTHCFEGVSINRRSKIHIHLAILVHCFTWTKGVAKKRELHTLELSPPINVLAVHYSSFLGMQLEPALPKSFSNSGQGKLGMRQTPTVNNTVSSPGESHPQDLSEPDVSVSAHPAPIIQPLV